jgi:hypothetical protein
MVLLTIDARQALHRALVHAFKETVLASFGARIFSRLDRPEINPTGDNDTLLIFPGAQTWNSKKSGFGVSPFTGADGFLSVLNVRPDVCASSAATSPASGTAPHLIFFATISSAGMTAVESFFISSSRPGRLGVPAIPRRLEWSTGMVHSAPTRPPWLDRKALQANGF